MGNNNYTQDQDSGYLASTLRVYPAFLRQHLKYSPCLKRQLHPRCPVEEPLSMLLVSDPALELATLPTNSNGMSANVDISMITFECDDLSTYLPPPHISSSFSVETSLSHSSPTCASYIPILHSIELSHNDSVIVLVHFLARAPYNVGSGFSQSCSALLLFLSFLTLRIRTQETDME